MGDFKIERADECQGAMLVQRAQRLRILGRMGMRWWKLSTLLALAALAGALGCGGSKSSGVTITVSPTSASVITNRTQQFTDLVTGSSNTTVTWSLTCATGAPANSCGTIDASGLYTAPATIPSTTSGGTTTTFPTVTITGTAQADTSKTAAAIVTIVTGIRITITPTSATVGTGETFLFTATVTNPGCNTTSNPTCLNVTWSLSTTLTGIGSIGSASGVYTAPSAVPSPSTVIITATSVADTAATATATVSVVTASKPTVTSVSPNATARGALFQDVYITGTNFISTDNVFVNGSQLASNFVTNISTSVIRARIPDYILASPPPSGVLQVGVSEQSGPVQTCTADPSACQVQVAGVRPGVVGPSPDSIPQSSAAVLSFNVDGGFFGTGASPASPAVSATYNGQLRAIQLPASGTINSTRQLSVTIGGGSNSSDFSVPGLYPVAVRSVTDATQFAVTNLAVQPTYTPPTSTRIAVGSVPASSAPSDVAVNPSTGIAVVANKGSNDISLIDLTTSTPTLIGNICTAAVGAVPPCPASAPTGVSVDYVRNIALVVNSATKTVAVVDLTTRAVSFVAPVLQDTPVAVGINPVSGRALIAMQQKTYGVLMDVTTNPPAYVGIVSISTGNSPHVAVEPHLNWAVVTPGGGNGAPPVGVNGSLGIVDLNQQSQHPITAMSRTTNVVTVTVQSGGSAPPLSVKVGDAVQIQNVQFTVCSTNSSDPSCAQASSFNGFYSVTSVGPSSSQFSYTQTGATLPDVAAQATPDAATGSVNYAQPVAIVGLPITVQGIGINPETRQAVTVDPTTGGVVLFLNLNDQSVNSLVLKVNNAADVGTIAAAYNPLTNIVVAVNSFANTLSVIDPTTPRRLNDNNLFSTLAGPVAVAIDPGTNIAVVANQADNSVSVLNLGAIRPFSITETSPKTILTTSLLGSGPNPSPQTLTVVGKGLTCAGGSTNLSVRLDGIALSTACSGTGDRLLTATVPFGMLTTARRFAVDVVDSSGNVTNAEDLTVEQSIDVTSASCPAPQPSGVAIDPKQNIAAVTLFGCNSVALINMATGIGSTVGVGSNPIGVAVIPRLHVAVVANNGGAGTASIVDELQQSVTQTVSTGSGPMGAAADEATGEVAIANSVANTVTVVNATTGGVSTISTGQGPVAVAMNYVNHQVAVANAGSSTISISGGTTGSASQTFNVSVPTSVLYDPVTTDCGSNSNGTTTNTAGCFLAVSSTANVAEVIDPLTSVQQAFRLGINPTAIAYNYRTSTLVSANTASHTISVADFLGQRIRAVLSLPPTTTANTNLAISLAIAGAIQYALDIHPFTNVAVIADAANGRVLFLPLPR
jgi:DNA-binding beta-propeller fold protein YncE